MTKPKEPGRRASRRELKAPRTLFAADWVLPVSSPPLAEGAVLVEGAEIREVGPARALKGAGADRVVDLGGHLILPGLVNAHSHLELSFLRGRLRPGEPFERWIEALVVELLGAGEETFREAVRGGLAEGLASGTTTFGDISRSGLSMALLAEAGLKGTVFLELLGFHPRLEEGALARALGALDELRESATGDLLVGLTPHAPYSTSAELYRQAASLAASRGLPLAVHVAETPEEERFVREGSGPLRELLQRFGLWHEGFSTPGCSAVAYLDGLGALKGALAVHCNTADDEDIGRLLSAGARVVLCPGSNAWFGRPARHPLPRLLRAGVPCALGTDSLASNRRLDMLWEMGLCAAAHPELPPEAVLRLATLSAAEALGLGARSGSLEAGKAADLVALRLPAGGADRPVEWVVAEATADAVALVAVDGAVMYPPERANS